MKLEFKPTPNVYDLDGIPEVLILHTTLGSYESAVAWLCMSPEERERRYGSKTYSSAHAVIGRLGEISELADVTKGTWHAGAVSNPSERAKAVIPKTLLGGLKNPNKHSIGLEFASGYDIDKDGVLESWEKLYTPQQVKACAEYILTRLEPEIERLHGKKITFGSHNIITHRDVTSYKPDLEIQRAMVIAELDKRREEQKPLPPVEETVVLKKGTKLVVDSIEDGIIKIKI